MERLRAVLVDDEPDALDALSTALAAFCPEIEVRAQVMTGHEAIAAVAVHEAQVLFADIRMPDMSGLEVVERLGTSRPPLVVFVTAHEDQAIRALKLRAFDYLLKPINVEELMATVAQLVRLFCEPVREGSRVLAARLSVMTTKGTEFIDPHRVVRVEASGSYSYLHLLDAKPMLVSRKLGELEAELVQHGFLRVHRSHLVNAKHVARFAPSRAGHQLVMSNGDHVEVARRKRPMLANAIGGHWA